SSGFAGQREDLVRAHLDGRGSPQPCDYAGAPATRPLGGDLHEPRDFAVSFELHLRVGQDPELLADFYRDGHLTLRRDSHGNTPTSNTTITGASLPGRGLGRFPAAGRRWTRPA